MLANHHRGLFAACLAVTLASQACQTSQETSPEAAGAMPVVDSRTALKEARFQEAVKGLDFDSGLVVVVEATGDDPQLALEYHEQGLERLESNRLTGALTMLARAVRTDPQYARGYASLGRALQAKGKGQYALAAFRTALMLDPDNVSARYELALALARLDRRDEAIAEMLRVLQLDPQHAPAHERLAIWYYYGGDVDSSWQHVHAARDLGREPPPQFIALLETQSPEPRR
ncbi:MAG: tetratricopeptide repeat protein [Planctomycetota bacterium]|jgi:tetratricopeptide (TPR) repeat protein